MGAAMARNLQGRGYSVCVRDIRSEAQDDALRCDMPLADSPAELAARTDVVLVAVVDSAQVADVLFGTPGCPGVVNSGRDGLTVLLCSTIDPNDVADFATRLAPSGTTVIDAPISGGPARALAATMSMMLAGNPAQLERLDPLLRDMAANRFYLGPVVGDASKAKLVNNLLAGINLVAAAEAMALGQRLGLKAQQVFDLVRVSSGHSWIFEDRMQRAIVGDYAPRAATGLLTKDVGLAVKLGTSVGAQTPLGEAALKQFVATIAGGWAFEDDAAVLKTYLKDGL